MPPCRSTRAVKRFLDALAAGKPPNALETTVEERRLGLAELMKLAGPQVPVGRVEDRTLPGPAGALGIRIYTPLGAGPEPLPGLIYFHGGGWWREPWRRMTPLGWALANSGACRVVSVDYRLAPEHPFPAALDDALAAVRHIGAHAAEYGINGMRLGICGDSAAARWRRRRPRRPLESAARGWRCNC